MKMVDEVTQVVSIIIHNSVFLIAGTKMEDSFLNERQIIGMEKKTKRELIYKCWRAILLNLNCLQVVLKVT